MMTNLIYDRTLEDVAEVRRLLAKLDPETGNGLTAAEQAKWDAGLKGAYNFTDLNRVESAVKTLSAALTSAGYPVAVTPVLKGGSRLPSGYTQLEYIESSGTQYIDTGVSAPEGCRVQCKVAYTSLSSTLADVFGSHDAAPPYYRNFLAATSSTWELGAYGTADFGSPTVNTEYEIDANTKSGEIACTINGTAYSINQSIAPSAQRSALSVYLFALHYADGLFPAKMKAWWYKVYVDGTLVRDFVPCKNPDGAVGLYDLIGGEFYTTPTAAEAVALPEGYTQVEYLQSSGTQYIDIGFKPNQDTRIVIDFTALTTSANAYAYGMRGDSAHNTNPRFGAIFKSASVRVDYGNGNGVTLPLTLTAGGRYKLDQNKNTCALNASTATNSTATFQCPNPAYLFAINEGGTAKYFATIKLYSGQVYDNGALIRNFVPARNAVGTLGLYDTVNGVFYTNKGSGAFTAGADIVGFTAGADVSPYEDREWQEGDVLYRPQWTTYLDNVQKLRDAYYTLAETGELPAPGDKLGYVGANNIEKVLADIDLLLDGMKSSYRRCGTFRAGNNAAHLPLKGSV